MSITKKERIIQAVIIFCIGSLVYSLIEVIFRQYTHWSMFLTGGAVFTALYFINLSLKTKSLVLRGLIGALVITVTEFVVGCVVNLAFKLNVWDYSHMPGNLLGQVCPWFSMCWFFLSIVAVYLSVFLYWQLCKKMKSIRER